ncbi:MAG: RecQ family ATP-dependent DNA helicase [Bacteroidales bacterium]|nr:RecQ family ATP-dependent DNA helicase [Bacteroidales bacterium]
MADKLQLLKRYWNHTSFRPCQEEIIDSVLAGRDTLALLPTGGGKSLCYQLPTLMMDGTCLVVSPLIALMKDQVQQLNERHIKAACLYAGQSPNEIFTVLNNAVGGQLKFLYVSPERLRSRMFIEHFRGMKVCLIAVDEAHCISQWGYDFRPPYLQLADIRQYKPTVPVIALTATATARVVDDICARLQMRQCQVFRTSFARPNLAYVVEHTADKQAALLRLCRRSGGCGIVYVGSRRRAETVADYLNSNALPAIYYHAGLTSAERDLRQAMWMKGECRIIVATNAFGMGIDKSDVRFVAHLDVPSSVESYFQEAGRAGRDGKAARAVLFCDDGDIKWLGKNFETDYPPLEHVRNAYRALCNYYRLPMGSGADLRYDFDIKAICNVYHQPLREFYACCQILEREGLVALTDVDGHSSNLFIPIGRDELYRFQVDHMVLGDMLQAIIRLYPGIFTESTPIDEKRIASRCYLDAKDVRQRLAKMNDMHIVDYTPSTDKPQIVFCSERVDERSIYLAGQNYDALKEAARFRLEAMAQYVSNDHECRSRQLLAYFGEVDGVVDCGQCDVCLRHLHVDDDVEQAVLQAVAQGRQSVVGLCEMLAEQNYIGVEDAVRRLLDCGSLQLDKNLFLSLS